MDDKCTEDEVDLVVESIWMLNYEIYSIYVVEFFNIMYELLLLLMVMNISIVLYIYIYIVQLQCLSYYFNENLST